ncbi:hypothetical protein [Oceanobacter kriegii]|nr:hypothetical protein [Oceanobacter kriegii]
MSIATALAVLVIWSVLFVGFSGFFRQGERAVQPVRINPQFRRDERDLD